MRGTMTFDEAREWLTGEMSTWNTHAMITNDRNHALARCAEEDAAHTERAYWMLRAHRENLLTKSEDVT